MSRAGRRHGNCRVFKAQGRREEESEGGRTSNECRAEWQSGGADVEGSEEKINLKSLREEGNRTQGHGTRREFERCDGCWRSRVGGNREDLCSRERPQGRDRRALP